MRLFCHWTGVTKPISIEKKFYDHSLTNSVIISPVSDQQNENLSFLAIHDISAEVIAAQRRGPFLGSEEIHQTIISWRT